MDHWKKCGLLSVAMWLGGCTKQVEPVPRPVKLPVGVVMTDRTFRSVALGRDVTYRVIAPIPMPGERCVRVVYLLHGNGRTYREWSESSAVATWASEGFVLVMPEGHSSYFMNAVTPSEDRYEDFVTRDLVADAERGLGPVGRSERAIVGVSMGGDAALVLGMKHPEQYGFVGALSPPVDVAERGFKLQRWGQWAGFRNIFGPEGSSTREASDAFVVVRRTDPSTMPYVFLGVGTAEPLRAPVERFAGLLKARGIRYEFHEAVGGHDWGEWGQQLAGLKSALDETGTER